MDTIKEQEQERVKEAVVEKPANTLDVNDNG
jgi:hypothetical protein